MAASRWKRVSSSAASRAAKDVVVPVEQQPSRNQICSRVSSSATSQQITLRPAGFHRELRLTRGVRLGCAEALRLLYQMRCTHEAYAIYVCVDSGGRSLLRLPNVPILSDLDGTLISPNSP